MKALITAEELAAYTGGYAEDQASLRATYASAASEIIKDFLGFDPNEEARVEYFDSTGLSRISLEAKPITAITKVEFLESGSWVEKPLAEFFIRDHFLYRASMPFSSGEASIRVSFTAGYAVADVPGIMKMTALRIGGVLAAEQDGNIGVSSKASQDTGTRVFLNSRFDRYLEPLENYRIYKI